MEVRDDKEAKEKLFSLIKDIKVALLVTRDNNDLMHARPMVAVKTTEFAGELWFFTSKTSPKVQEIQHNPHVLLSYANPDDQHYVSVRGDAELIDDREKIRELWSEYIRTWFPKGKDDPDIGLIKITVTTAEYWDAPSSRFVHFYGYLKASLTGKSPKGGENCRVVY